MKRAVSTGTLVVAAALAAPGCGVSRTRKSLDHQKLLMDAIEAFESSRLAVGEIIDGAVKPAVASLSKDRADLEAVAKEWERDWEEATEAVPGLEEAFVGVGQEAEEYIQELERLAAAMSDAALRAQEEQRSHGIRSAWQKAYFAAGEQVAKIKGLGARGEDFHRLLLGAALRKDIEKQHVQQLNLIAADATASVAELARLTVVGKSLAGGSSLRRADRADVALACAKEGRPAVGR